MVQSITRLFEHQPRLTLEQIREQLEEKVPDRTLRYYLLELKSRGLLSLQGRGPRAVWIWQGLK
jgi:predicted HTH transcriptional regulator